MQRIVVDSHTRKGPRVVSHGEGDTEPRRVPKSTKKVRAPTLPPSTPPAQPLLTDYQDPSRDVSSTGKTPSSDIVSRTASVEQRDTEPQRPPRQKKQSDSRDSQRRGRSHPLPSDGSSTVQIAEITNASSDVSFAHQAPPSTATTTTGAAKTRSSKRRPAPLPNPAQQPQIQKVLANIDSPQVSSEYRHPKSSDEKTPKGNNMPTKVSERSSQVKLKLETTNQPESGGSAPGSDPPPLPISAPPPLPSSPPPLFAVQDPLKSVDNSDSVEEISIEYTVPIKLSGSEFGSGIEGVPSSSQLSLLESNRDNNSRDNLDKSATNIGVNAKGSRHQNESPPKVLIEDNHHKERKNSIDSEESISIDSDISDDEDGNEGSKGGRYDFFSPGEQFGH